MQPAYYYAQPIQPAYYPPPQAYAPQPAMPQPYYGAPQQAYAAPVEANPTLAQFHQVVQAALTALPLGTLPGDTVQISPQAQAPAAPPAETAQPEPAKTEAPKPEPAKPEPAPAPEATYTVRSGDSLSKIAQRTLGDSNRWREVYDLNRQQISNPNLIVPGQVLKLPGGAKAPSQPTAPSAPAAPGTILARFTVQEVANSLGAPMDNVQKYWPAIARALEEANITSDDAVKAVLATIKTEVGSFEPIPEYASGREYEGRSDLGNTHAGDGVRYKGRGFIQLTGRANYRTYGQAIGVDLEGNPDLALDPTIAAKVLVEYFKRRGIPAMAERGDWQDVRKAVNGGLNGYNTFIAAVNRLDDVAVA